ncbi:MAG: glutamine-hydrolyzing carbamoyl-phosphate synthase small subunit [Candidatus Pelagibacterales bacterium]|jgi:carbamoyl-phosphate synthase small subunit|tara:strand:+ start:4153 stop:5298 length:1146 start_codon:yes stop_codon:yes gene_type:complete
MSNIKVSKNGQKVSRPIPIPATLVLENNKIFNGIAIGARKTVVGEVCFNTSMTGYQEIISDPSYAGQIINFTFPHIGNVGTNLSDNETLKPYTKGVIINCDISNPSNFRSIQHLDEWLKTHEIPGICNVDTRDITNLIRDFGALKGSLSTLSKVKINDLKKINKDWSGLNGLDLAKEVTCAKPFKFNKNTKAKYKIVAIDYGIKLNILNSLAQLNAEITVVPASTAAEEIIKMKPDGVFLSNGPGDPKATGKYAIPIVKKLIEKNIPLFGICLGHQIIALALGAKTKKMFLGHRGANHPVKNLNNGLVEITSQNHGFEVTKKSIPSSVKVTHVSLFDGCIEGLKHKTKKIFSVQYHPESSPGPHDSHYLFNEFIEMIKGKK